MGYLYFFLSTAPRSNGHWASGHYWSRSVSLKACSPYYRPQLTLACGRVVRPLSKPGDVGVADDAATADQLVAMATGERARAAVRVIGRRAVT